MSNSDDNNRNVTFILTIGISVVLAIILVAGGIYFYVRPETDQPQDQAQSIEEIQQPRDVTLESLRETIDEQLDSLNEDDFDQSSLSDDALGIN